MDRRKSIHRKLRMITLLLSALIIILAVCKQNYCLEKADISPVREGELKVHFIDVGQGDCILIQSDGENMLLDAGSNDDAVGIINYLNKLGVKKLDYVIGTHGHEDHIGSLDAVIYNFGIGTLFMPKQKYNSRSYQEVLEAAKIQGVKIEHPKYLEKYRLGYGKFVFVTPNEGKDYPDLNDSSLGIRITNGTHSFLLCGDISKEMEAQMVRERIYLKSDVLKLNHHGSSDTNSKEFLEWVSPGYAVISCEWNNDFGHPHKSVMKRLKAHGIKFFRTDEQGTIVFTSDGDQLICNVEPLSE